MKTYFITSLINGFYQYLVLSGRSIKEIKEKLNREYPMLELLSIKML